MVRTSSYLTPCSPRALPKRPVVLDRLATGVQNIRCLKSTAKRLSRPSDESLRGSRLIHIGHTAEPSSKVWADDAGQH